MLDYYPDPSGVTIDDLRVAVSAFVWDDKGRLLLQQRGDNGYWCFPGGGVERGESVTDALCREVWEETGYTIRPGRLIGVYSDPRKFQLVRYPEGATRHAQSIGACRMSFPNPLSPRTDSGCRMPWPAASPPSSDKPGTTDWAKY